MKGKAQQENLKSAITNRCKQENCTLDWEKAKIIHSKHERWIIEAVKKKQKRAEKNHQRRDIPAMLSHNWSTVLVQQTDNGSCQNLTGQSRLSNIEWRFGGRRKGSGETVTISRKPHSSRMYEQSRPQYQTSQLLDVNQTSPTDVADTLSLLKRIQMFVLKVNKCDSWVYQVCRNSSHFLINQMIYTPFKNMRCITLFNQQHSQKRFISTFFLGTSARLKWATLARRKVLKEQCDPALLAIRFEKHSGRSGCRGTALPLCQHLSLWHEQHAPHALKWLLLDTKTDSARRPCPTSSTCPLCSAVPESRLEQMADDPRAHLLTFPPVSSFTLQALLHTLASY